MGSQRWSQGCKWRGCRERKGMAIFRCSDHAPQRSRRSNWQNVGGVSRSWMWRLQQCQCLVVQPSAHAHVGVAGHLGAAARGQRLFVVLQKTAKGTSLRSMLSSLNASPEPRKVTRVHPPVISASLRARAAQHRQPSRVLSRALVSHLVAVWTCNDRLQGRTSDVV